MLTVEQLEKKKEVARLLSECVITCNHCFSACLKEDDVKMMTECIRLDKDCAEVCAFTLLIFHRSRFVHRYIQLCTEVCDACAEECRKFQHDHCKKCAEACKKCADACRSFMKMFQK